MDDIAELEIRGDVARGPYVSVSGSPLVPVAALLQQLDDARECRPPVLLLTVRALGGEVFAGLALYDALRVLSESGVPVVAHVEQALCTAATFVAAADFIVADPAVLPEAVVAFHGGGCQALEPDAPDGQAVDRLTRVATYATAAILAGRSLVPFEQAASWVAPDVQLGAALGPEEAVAFGFADLVGGRAQALRLCQDLAGGGSLPTSPRRAALAAADDGRLRAARDLGRWVGELVRTRRPDPCCRAPPPQGGAGHRGATPGG